MDLQLKKEEAQFRASLFKSGQKTIITKRGRRLKAVPYTLSNADAVIGTFIGKDGKKRQRTKINFGGGLNIYHKHIGEQEREQRAKIREANKHIQDIDLRRRVNQSEIDKLEAGLFVTNEKTLCTSIRRPKKGANEKQAKIARSYDKNKKDAERAESADLYMEWERTGSGLTFQKWNNKRTTDIGKKKNYRINKIAK